MIINIIAALFLIVLAVALVSCAVLARHHEAWTPKELKHDVEEIKQIPSTITTIISQIISDIKLSPIN